MRTFGDVVDGYCEIQKIHKLEFSLLMPSFVLRIDL